MVKFVIKGYRAACQMFGLQPIESNLPLLYIKNVLSFSRKLTRAIVTAAGCSWSINVYSKMWLHVAEFSSLNKTLSTWTVVFILFTLFFFSYDTKKENLFDNQQLLKLVIIFFILVIFKFDSVVMHSGEIIEASLL